MLYNHTSHYENIRNNWTRDEVSSLFNLSFNDLIFQSHSIHRKFFDPNELQLSKLLSIKTGSCPEDCKYCPQSAHYNTDIEKTSLMNINEILDIAKSAKDSGSTRFCMGVAWRNINDRDLKYITDVIAELKKIGMELCLTAGMVTQNQAEILKKAGLDYYNHNIDTSEEYYKKIITTRNFDDRIKTLENIRESGLKTCCGGIIGMGETIEDRISMLITLSNMGTHPESVPINMLVKIDGTPLSNVEDLDPFDFIRVIAVARIIMPKSYVRLSAGRNSMNDQTQALCFFAGANSLFYGDKLLTTPNPDYDSDIELINKLGMKYKAA